MEVNMLTLHMNQGTDETSYFKNSSLQWEIISTAKSIIEKAVEDSLYTTLPSSMGIADLGCSSGPNSLMLISKIIDAVYSRTGLSIPLPELRISLNDLPGNDFNAVLGSLPEFYRKQKEEKGMDAGDFFVSAVAGSFYGRLFPQKSLHLVHSSSSLHWLSRVPPALHTNGGKEHMNKGKIYISKASPASVAEAYLSQFQKDFSLFLRSRAVEVVAGGGMVLSFMGRSSSDPSAEVGCHQWELLAQALMSMASEGLVDEEKIDSFDAPYYAPYVEEVLDVIKAEKSFMVDHVETFKIQWDEGSSSSGDFIRSRGQNVAKIIRAVVESMLESHFGQGIMDELFARYAHLVDLYFSKTTGNHLNIVVSVTKTSEFFI